MICRANQQTGFYMIGTSVIKELNRPKIATMNAKLKVRFGVSVCRTFEIEKHTLLRNNATTNKKNSSIQTQENTKHKNFASGPIIRNA